MRWPRGDHDIALLRIHGLHTAAVEPLVFHASRFRSLATTTD
ncbi:hypothetical protein [Pseudonocardia xishanensis]